ncbi:MAG: hypothetical protein ABI707_04135 [Ferruginibacter sp.]
MKKFFLFLFILSLSQSGFADPKKDTTIVGTDTSKVPPDIKSKKPGDLSKIVNHDSIKIVAHDSMIKSLGKKLDSLRVSVKASKDSTSIKNCNCVPNNNKELNFGEWLLILSPLVAFLIIFIFIGRIPKDFRLNEALTENDQDKMTSLNPQYTVANLKALENVPNLTTLIPATLEMSSTNPTFRPSISRYIAYIASIMTLMVALSMSCFFIYNYVSTGCPPDLSALSTILIALGIGVAPYAFNKVAGAIVTNKS